MVYRNFKFYLSADNYIYLFGFSEWSSLSQRFTSFGSLIGVSQVVGILKAKMEYCFVNILSCLFDIHQRDI